MAGCRGLSSGGWGVGIELFRKGVVHISCAALAIKEKDQAAYWI